MRWTHEAYVESDTEIGRAYEIKRSADGRLGCECPRYRFKRGEKTCKHLRAFVAGETMDAQRAVKPTVRAERVRSCPTGPRRRRSFLTHWTRYHERL